MRRAASTISDDPDNLDQVDDDFKVLGALLAEQECDLKENIWVELTKNYFREQEWKIFLFLFFLLNLPSPSHECHGMANINIIVKRLKKETGLHHGIIKSAKSARRINPVIATARKWQLLLPTVRRTCSCAGVIPRRPITKPLRGFRG